ncbi:MAG: glycerophosphodiester phosphodiesterase family protein [Bacteroidota bacterium]
MKFNLLLSVAFVLVFLCSNTFLFGQKLNKITVEKGQIESFLDQEVPMISAHRGGRYIAGKPENSIEVFKYTLKKTPAILECDVNMTKDSVLVLLHDYSVDRTTDGTGKIKDLYWTQARNLKLLDDFDKPTKYKIPTFKKTLKWARKKAILSVDVKRGVPFERVVEMVEKNRMEDYVFIITYNLEDAQKVYALNPNLQISVSIRNEEELQRMLKSGIPADNMVAFTGTKGIKPDLYTQLEEYGIPAIVGTMGNLDRQAKANNETTYQEIFLKGGDILATDRPVEAAGMIRKMIGKKEIDLKNISGIKY